MVKLKADQEQAPKEVQHLQGADRVSHVPATRHPAQDLGWKKLLLRWNVNKYSTVKSFWAVYKVKNIPVCFLFIAGQKRLDAVIPLDLQIIGTGILMLLL